MDFLTHPHSSNHWIKPALKGNHWTRTLSSCTKLQSLIFKPVRLLFCFYHPLHLWWSQDTVTLWPKEVNSSKTQSIYHIHISLNFGSSGFHSAFLVAKVLYCAGAAHGPVQFAGSSQPQVFWGKKKKTTMLSVMTGLIWNVSSREKPSGSWAQKSVMKTKNKQKELEINWIAMENATVVHEWRWRLDHRWGQAVGSCLPWKGTRLWGTKWLPSSTCKELIKMTEWRGWRMTDNIKSRLSEAQIGYKEKVFHQEDGQAVEQVAQAGCAVSVLGDFHD